MAHQWFIRLGGKEHGPFSSSQLKQLAHQGKISHDTEVRRGESGSWIAAGRVKGLFAVASQTETAATSAEDNAPDASGRPPAPSGTEAEKGTVTSSADASEEADDEYALATDSPAVMPGRSRTETDRPRGEVCPRCSKSLSRGATKCGVCGYNLVPPRRSDKPAFLAPVSPDEGLERKEGTGDWREITSVVARMAGLLLAWWGFVGVGILLGALLGSWAHGGADYLARHSIRWLLTTLMQFTLWPALMAHLAAWLWSGYRACTESIWHGLMCTFVPLYGVYYTITRWDRMEGPLYAMLGFAAVACFGAGILLTGPTMFPGPPEAEKQALRRLLDGNLGPDQEIAKLYFVRNGLFWGWGFDAQVIEVSEKRVRLIGSVSGMFCYESGDDTTTTIVEPEWDLNESWR